jgi:hypothetical protein
MTATVPGLAIVREPCARESWAVLHARSGGALIIDLAGAATAEWAAQELSGLLDWTKDRHEVAATADLLVYVEPAIERIAVRHGGVTLGPQAVYVP